MIHCGRGFSCHSPIQPTGSTVTNTVANTVASCLVWAIILLAEAIFGANTEMVVRSLNSEAATLYEYGRDRGSNVHLIALIIFEKGHCPRPSIFSGHVTRCESAHAQGVHSNSYFAVR
jgi:hypothetical protein